jgi:hypothetical protein
VKGSGCVALGHPVTSTRFWLPEKDDGSEADAAFEPLRRQMFVFSYDLSGCSSNEPVPTTAQGNTDALGYEDSRNLVPDPRARAC